MKNWFLNGAILEAGPDWPPIEYYWNRNFSTYRPNEYVLSPFAFYTAD